MIQPARRSWLVWIASLVAVAWLVFSVLTDERRLGAVFVDDAYYYFGVARNVARGLGSTFNGVDRTNGYHPLWLLLLVPIFAVTAGKASLIAVVALSGLLLFAAALIVREIGRDLDDHAAVGLGFSVLLVLSSCGPAYFVNGMETALLMTCEIALVLVLVRTRGLAPEVVAPRPYGVGALIATAVLARLDSVFVLAALAGYAALRWRHTSDRQARLAALCLPTAVTLVVYVAVNELLFGTWMPVSGQAKVLGGATLNSTPLHQFFRWPEVAGVSLRFGLLALVIVPVALALARRGYNHRATALAEASAMLFAASLSAMAYYCLASTWKVWPYYFASNAIVVFAGAASIAASLRERWRAWTSRCAAVALSLSAIAVLVRLHTSTIRVDPNDITISAVDLALRLNRELPEHAVVAIGDRAGAFGYVLERPVVHLEGLVSSRAFLDALRAGRMHAFLDAHHVDYYARYIPFDRDTGVPAGLAGCTQYDEPFQGRGPKAAVVVCADDLVAEDRRPNGTAGFVWRYRSELNPVP